MEFKPFNKIPRLFRNVVISEKIDGTNAQVYISPDREEIVAASRNRWLTVEDDNFGFAKWVQDNREELLKLGPGHHYGEWWGVGIQRGYGLSERRFSLFSPKWANQGPACCRTVPVLWQGIFNQIIIDDVINGLRVGGSVAAPGFKEPEGVVVYHTASRNLFKVTLDNDAQAKGEL